MIQPNEKLLPGNVVMYNHEDGDRAIKLSSYVIFEIATDKINQRSFSPIPLTPEILVRWCGWEKMMQLTDIDNGELINISLGKFDIYANLKNKSLMVVDEIEGAINIPLPEHLHTLQNTVYFISGEEMIVNLPK